MSIGLKMSLDAPQWLRGSASVQNGWLTIDRKTAEPYSPFDEGAIALDLGRVGDQSDAVAFATRYGLLKHGAITDLREPVDDFFSEVHSLKSVLMMAKAVRGAVDQDDDSKRLLRETIEPIIRPFFEVQATGDTEIAIQTTQMIAWMVSAKLIGVEHSLEAIPNSVGKFALSVRSPTLLGYVYAHVAQLIAQRARLRSCRECGGVFVVDDDRQQFCSPAHSKRGRQRRWAAKDAAKVTKRGANGKTRKK